MAADAGNAEPVVPLHLISPGLQARPSPVVGLAGCVQHVEEVLGVGQALRGRGGVAAGGTVVGQGGDCRNLACSSRGRSSVAGDGWWAIAWLYKSAKSARRCSLGGQWQQTLLCHSSLLGYD